MSVPFESYISLGSYRKEYGEVEPYGGRYNPNRYLYVYSEEKYHWPPLGQRKIIVVGVDEISEPQLIHLLPLSNEAEFGYFSADRDTVFEITVPERDIDVLLWWNKEGALIGKYPYSVDYRDIKGDQWTLGDLRYGLFER